MSDIGFMSYLLTSGACTPSCGRLSRIPPTIPVSLCVLFGERPSLLPVGSDPPTEPLQIDIEKNIGRDSVEVRAIF